MSSLDSRLRRVEAQTAGGGVVLSDRPTASELWLWRLEDVVSTLVKNGGGASSWVKDGEYDHFRLYAHRSCLRSKADVEAAPDQVLLEALRLDGASMWGWLQFMIREINWYSLLAANWSLPSMRGSYGGGDARTRYSKSNERWAQAAVYFCDLMRERGVDVQAQIAEAAQAQMESEGLAGEDVAAFLRERHEWAHIVHTSESLLTPDLMGESGKVAYSGESGTQFLAEIRAAAARRRELWDAPLSCACLNVAK